MDLRARQMKMKSINKQLINEKIELTAENDKLKQIKEWLLNEIQHRVNNNLQTVVSLLELQITALKNDALKAVEKSRHRIYVIALIYQKSYQHEDVQAVDIAGFVSEIILYLNESYASSCENIQFQLDIDQLGLSISQAIPIALIINEAVTNSLQHAFNEQNTGKIIISLKQSGRRVRLIIADNGLGIVKPSDGLGLTLMKGLTEDINGRIRFDTRLGTKISVNFNIVSLGITRMPGTI